MNNKINVLVYAAGVYNFLFAIFHVLFWRLKLFNWEEELPKMSVLNSAVMQVMNMCLIAVFLLSGFISFYHNDELINSSLGKSLLIGFSIFWLLRLIEQFVFFGYRGPLPAVFLLGFLLYAIPALYRLIIQ
ncbi:MAG: hypothetical protein KA369_15445 [Spirochaetes bacterium]|nr:hypothetical protein [Spirochaetota bacterium]